MQEKILLFSFFNINDQSLITYLIFLFFLSLITWTFFTCPLIRNKHSRCGSHYYNYFNRICYYTSAWSSCLLFSSRSENGNRPKQRVTKQANTMVIKSVLFSFIFPPPPSLVVWGLTVTSFLILANAFLSEIRGKHLNYSKFWNANPSAEKQVKLSSKAGMLLLYTPAFLAGLASFWIFPHQGLRSTLLQSAVTLHFFKRVFEVCNFYNR